MKSKLIFIVDDDESVCRALGILLDTYGFRVEAFVCAKDFFNAVPNSAAVCLLLDIHMPGLDGWETLQRLSKSVSSLPVIIMSAEKKEGFNEKVLRAGALGFLQKPFNDKDLIDLINIAVKKKR